MEPYQLCIPTNLFFGRDIWKTAIRKLEPILCGNIMIATTGRSLVRLGYLDELRTQIKRCSRVKRVIIYDHVSANPRLSEAREGIRTAREEKIDVVIGFGGGSAIDMAKAIAAGAGSDEAVEVFFYQGREPGKGTLPVIAIPTTAGTGSELSKAAILTDEEKKIKNGIRGSALYPKAAIVDSVFTESVPFDKTMETGFDVLAHAMESYVAKAASPYTRMQSGYAVRIVGKMLPALALNLQDIDARSEMSYASMIMGINLGNAGTGLPHRLQYPLGAYTDTSHGKGLAALYTAWIDCEYPYSPVEIEKMLCILTGKKISGREECVRVMKQFLLSLRLPISLKELGIDRSMLPGLAECVSGNIGNDPASGEQDILLKLYERAWQEEV